MTKATIAGSQKQTRNVHDDQELDADLLWLAESDDGLDQDSKARNSDHATRIDILPLNDHMKAALRRVQTLHNTMVSEKRMQLEYKDSRISHLKEELREKTGTIELLKWEKETVTELLERQTESQMGKIRELERDLADLSKRHETKCDEIKVHKADYDRIRMLDNGHMEELVRRNKEIEELRETCSLLKAQDNTDINRSLERVEIPHTQKQVATRIGTGEDGRKSQSEQSVSDDDSTITVRTKNGTGPQRIKLRIGKNSASKNVDSRPAKRPRLTSSRMVKDALDC